MAGTVLVVEDEPDILLAVSLNLRLAGHRVLEAPTGEAAVSMMDQEVPDLMLLDLRLPGIDGFDVLQHVRDEERLRHLPVIVVSAHASPNTVERVHELGCSAYVTKPFQLDRLLSVVDEHIGGKAKQS